MTDTGFSKSRKPRVGDGTPGPGRPRGSKNKANAAREAAIAASGMTPLDYLMSVMRDEDQTPDARRDAAKAAAPYVHPKLASIEMSGKDGGPIEHAVDVSGLSTEALREIAALGAKKSV